MYQENTFKISFHRDTNISFKKKLLSVTNTEKNVNPSRKYNSSKVVLS